MANIDETWFDDCMYEKEPYDDFECIITPLLHENGDGFFDGWKHLLYSDGSYFWLKAYCTRWEDEPLYEKGILYDCYVDLFEDDITPNVSYELAHFHAHDRDEAMRLLIAAANALNF